MGFCILLKVLVKILVNIGENASCKYSPKLLDHAKQSTTDAFETASNRAI